ncbi:KPN_02809 family neutral zinc metallopeptidase [Amaricoccus tamworthensis]|uniref:KPN_02809 family neutral zinc metallopeptidase n=1 Tax=Amaricoccus tamworthensis TaxID=57002 RepID=UPI003C7EA693
MKWRGKRTSGNIQDRRRGGGMGRAGGIGGLGMIVVILVGLFFGVDLTPFLGGGGVGGNQVTTSQSADSGQIDDEAEEFVSVVLRQTEEVWTDIFAASGYQYEEPTLVLFTGATSSACGAAQSAMGPFYCPGDRQVYLDMDFFRVMEQELGSQGDFAKAYVVAHEVGHHVQNLTGLLGEVNQMRRSVSQAESNALSVRVELQADCYSGVWARHVVDDFQLTEEDIRSALDTAARIGDDALQRSMNGVVVPDSFTHGTSEQRQRWFDTGFRTGDEDQCDTFSTNQL